MALNLADRIACRSVILPRCTAAVVQYANYLLGLQEATVPQKGWAREAIRSPATVGDSVSWHLLNHADYISSGSSIADNVLQAACETAINNHFIQGA